MAVPTGALNEDGTPLYFDIIPSRHFQVLASTQSNIYLNIDHETQEANSNLIAAAPEMLEALEYAREWIDGMPASQYVLEKIDIAIAKAYGINK